MKITADKLANLDKRKVDVLIDHSQKGHLKAFAIQGDTVIGYISLYLHDKVTYEVNAVVAESGLGKIMYAVASMELSKDRVWICASTTNDTNPSAMRVWDSLRKDHTVEKKKHPDLEDNLVDFAVKINPEEWFNKRRLDAQNISAHRLQNYSKQGQALFDQQYDNA